MLGRQRELDERRLDGEKKKAEAKKAAFVAHIKPVTRE